MELYLIILLFAIMILVIVKLITPTECKHEDQVYYDAAGDELPGDQSEACFYECKQCGQTFVIPSGFQSDAHFENYLLYGVQFKKRIRETKDE